MRANPYIETYFFLATNKQMGIIPATPYMYVQYISYLYRRIIKKGRKKLTFWVPLQLGVAGEENINLRGRGNNHRQLYKEM